MHRRGLGRNYAKQGAEAKEKRDKVSVDLKEYEITTITSQLETFKKNLEEFALKHKSEIRRNPAFRMDFQKMCSEIGVDPLASQKGFWSELLGMGDFYYELGIQVIEACLATRVRNGGLMDITARKSESYHADLRNKLMERRDKSLGAISEDDLERAIAKLRVLGKGFTIVLNGRRKIVQSLPMELNTDHAEIISRAKNGRVLPSELIKEAGWSADRCQASLMQLVKEGLLWVDDGGSERSYWFPGLFAAD